MKIEVQAGNKDTDVWSTDFEHVPRVGDYVLRDSDDVFYRVYRVLWRPQGAVLLLVTAIAPADVLKADNHTMVGWSVPHYPRPL